jgi:hypothetical protein
MQNDHKMIIVTGNTYGRQNILRVQMAGVWNGVVKRWEFHQLSPEHRAQIIMWGGCTISEIPGKPLRFAIGPTGKETK